MNGEVIKSFLVGLGFGVDEASLAKFNKSIKEASLKITALYTSIKLTSAAIIYGISKVSEGFEQMGYEYRIIAPAINKALVLRRELLKAYSAAGINIRKVVMDSLRLNMSLTKTKFALEAIYKSVASRFFSYLTKQSDVFRQKLYANMPKIQNGIEKFVKVIFKALEATTALGVRLWSILTRIYDFFVMLDKATDGWSTIIFGVIAAWKLLNLEFLATPLGMLLAGFVALLALFDDYKTWKEGGQSFFNWSKVAPSIEAAIELFKVMLNIVVKIFETLNALVHLDFSKMLGSLGQLLAAINGLNGAIDKLVRSFGVGWINKLMSLRDSADGFFGLGPNAAANIQTTPGVSPIRPNIGNVSSSQTNQNVNQQTNINIMGSPDANAVGKSVAGEQGRVNGDLVRNLKPRAQ